MRWIWLLCRVIFGAVFVYAGAEKMLHADAFALAVFNYQILPAKLVQGTALLLPALEALCGLALCVNVMARGATVVLNCLMGVFFAAMGLAVARGLNVDCGCFGGTGQAISRETLIRDGVILAVGLIALWGAFAEKRKRLPELF